jgi:hypothetical protein
VEEHRLADAAVALAGEDLGSDPVGALAALALLHMLRENPGRELVLLTDDAADSLGIFAGFQPIHDHGANRKHPLVAGADRFEIHDPRHTLAVAAAATRREVSAGRNEEDG